MPCHRGLQKRDPYDSGLNPPRIDVASAARPLSQATPGATTSESSGTRACWTCFLYWNRWDWCKEPSGYWWTYLTYIILVFLMFLSLTTTSSLITSSMVQPEGTWLFHISNHLPIPLLNNVFPSMVGMWSMIHWMKFKETMHENPIVDEKNMVSGEDFPLIQSIEPGISNYLPIWNPLN